MPTEQTTLAPWRSRIVAHADVAPSELMDNPRNWRQHPKPQADAVSDVLDTVGFVQSVVVNRTSGRLVDGHLRVKLARERGEPSVPVVYVELSDDEEALVLATLDPLSSMAETNADALASLLDGMTQRMGALGAMLAGLSENAGLNGRGNTADDPGPQIDRAEELREKWGTERGQLWEIGRHRLLCGDSTVADDVARLLDGEMADICVTSPPYWIGREYERERGRDEVVAHIDACVKTISPAVRDHIVINTGTTVETKQGGDVRHVWLLLDWWADAFRRRDWYLRNVRIWRKEGGFSSFAPSQDVVGQDWEFLASFTRSKPRGQNRVGERWALDGVWDCQPQTASVGHSAPFPVEIPSRYLLLYTEQGERIMDTYSGSGTTLVAAEQTGRICYGMEIEPKYIAVALERLAGMGLTPRLAP